MKPFNLSGLTDTLFEYSQMISWHRICLCRSATG